MKNTFNEVLPSVEGKGSTGFEQLQWLLQNNLVYYVKWIMVAVSIGYLTFYGFLYVTSAGKEENITEQHDNLIWALVGFVIVGVSNLSMDIFAPLTDGGNKASE